MLKRAKDSALKRGIAFDLTKDDIFLVERCPILGIVLDYRAEKLRSDQSPSLDRIDNQRGYVKGNVAVISWRANSLKQNGSAAEHQAIAKWMIANGVR